MVQYPSMGAVPDILRALWREYTSPQRVITASDAGDLAVLNHLGLPSAACSRRDMLSEAVKLAEAARAAEDAYWVSVGLLKVHYGMSEREICGRLSDRIGHTVNRTTLRSKISDPVVLRAAERLIRVSTEAGNRCGIPFLE